jgi:hypothetical protein
VTIVYAHEDPNFWNLLCGRIPKILVRYEVIPLQADQYGEYYEDAAFRKSFQSWINKLWREKDSLIDTLLIKE